MSAKSFAFENSKPRLWSRRAASPVEDDCACASSGPSLFLARQHHSAVENDCACANTVIHRIFSQARVSTPVLTQVSETLVWSLRPGYWLLFSPYAPQGPVVLNEAAYRRWQSFAHPQPLQQPIDAQLQAAALIWRQGVLPPAPPTEQPEILSAWLHLTDACNLACPYCYVRKRPRSMTREIGQRAVRSLVSYARREGFRTLKLKYAGGEPTLTWDLFTHLHQEAARFAATAGVALRAVLLTNATLLTLEQAQWLQKQGVKIAISLDGVGSVHDRLRPAVDGQSAFQRLMHTVDEVLLPLGLRPSVTVTVTRWNASYLPETLAWILDRDLPFSLNFYRQPWNLRPPEDLTLEEEVLLRGMRAAFRILEQVLPTWPFLDGLMDRGSGLPRQQPCGVGHSYLVVTPQGQVAPCHMQMERSLGPVEALTPESLARGPIRNLPIDQRSDCRSCPFRYLCAGGCPLETYRATGRWDVRNPNCRIYRALYPEALRLEGLRLLKVHGVLEP